jgi:FOG: WD40 repeat
LKLNIPSIINQPLISEGLKIKPEAELVLNNLNPTYRQQLLNLARKYCMDHNLKEIDTRAVFFNKPDILKCYSSKVSLKYESHDGPVSGICCNPFHRNLFVSSSYDGTVKLFNGLQKDAIIVLEPVLACKVSCVAWSEVRPLLLAVGSENGSVYFYDFLQSNTNFVAEITNSRNSVVDLKFHKGIKDYLAIGFRNGEVRVYSLPDVFTVAHPDEGRRLRLLLENIFYELKSFFFIFYKLPFECGLF